MPKKEVISEIGGRKIKLSNLEKVLYPSAGIVKAQLMEYYIKVADYMLPFISGRPLTLIRYPDGIEADRFYSKNRPSWTPSWVGKVQVDPSDDNIYNTANDVATLAWLASLATLELHPMTMTASELGRPDHFIFDLDPSEQVDFSSLKDLAMDLRVFLEGYGYHPFLKTSGGKGLHIYVPIQPKYEQTDVIAAVKELAESYVKTNPSTTLSITKNKRQGKVLLDIYRNNKSQTCVAPYSTRGKKGCPVSTPLDWDELPQLAHSGEFTLLNVLDKLQSMGDPWSHFREHAQPLHTAAETAEVADEKLAAYVRKRDFAVTSEPSGTSTTEQPAQHRYVIQLHDASNLHYDLRLEMDGVLRSWAIPKGIPSTTGTKRLAIETEPHPLQYLTYEGIIPAGEYGGGTMWVFDKGQYKMETATESKLVFTLDGAMTGRYRLVRTGGKQWLLELLDSNRPVSQSQLQPMLASAASAGGLPSRDKYFYEIKWDGIRVIIEKAGKEVVIRSRSGNDITNKFPNIVAAMKEIEAVNITADGEIVALDESGLPHFGKTVGRMHLTGKAAISKAANRTKTVAYLFDCLYLDGRLITSEPIERRRAWLRANMEVSYHVRYSETFEEGKELMAAVTAQGMEGIMCKRAGSLYHMGSRTKDWLKVKVSNTDEALVIGYTAGKGDRQGLFGSLHLAKKDPEGWVYMGRVGTGFNQEKLREVYSMISQVGASAKLVDEAIEEEHRTSWIEPIYAVALRYASMTPNGTYREPVFIDIWPSLDGIR